MNPFPHISASAYLPPQHVTVEELEPEDDDIRTEYHPSSNRPTETVHFEDYGHTAHVLETQFDDSSTSIPWYPFPTRIDFEAADLVHDVAMNKAQTELFLSLLRRCASGETVHLQNHRDIVDTWEKSRIHHTPVQTQ